jgi:CMP-N,N'-diacetyllegionaminic acid synthase
MAKTLVIGYGSIGKRHADILSSMDMVSEVSVMSSQKNLPYQTIRSIKEIKDIDPSYIVVASNTSRHFEELYYLENNFRGKTILVEKPLFHRYHALNIQNNSVWVGYNLRFHPLMQLIKEKVAGKNLWHVQVFCGSYLPEWRPGRNYRTTSSTRKNAGGGVLLDLSHELDYVQWLCGKITPEYVRSEKVSDLDIETDDLMLLIGRTENGAILQITLNYFTRKASRWVIIDGEGISIQADLIARSVTIHEDGEVTDHVWPDLERNATYKAEHEALLIGNTSNACTYEEGLETICLIDTIRGWKN